MLAAVFLSDESVPDSGNLWVWPGSHLAHQQLFAERGPTVLLATSGHTLSLDEPPPLGDPRPVTARRGDLLLAHFLLGHNIGGNTSPATRRIL
jgi:ectoine hydroxylase-related dioxygenase (phytanoyl-CoA dioxygenase family)